MHYKTITLELLSERPKLYEELRTSKRLLTAMEAYAIDLKASHEDWKQRLAEKNPQADPAVIASAALELAVEELMAHLPCESLMGEAEPMTAAATDFPASLSPTA